jgi:hypothetical protein
MQDLKRGEELYHYVKLTLRVDHYFHVLTLFKSLWLEGATYTSHPRVATKQLYWNNINISSIKLTMWWLPQTSGTHIRESRWFKSIYTLQGKIWLTRYTLSMLGPCMTFDHMYLTRFTHINSVGQSHSLRKRAPDLIHSTMADRSTGSYPSSLPRQPLK